MSNFTACRFLLHSVAIPLVAISLMLSAPASSTAAAHSTDPVVTAAPKSVGEIQLADEIVRRLRRLGLNFNRGRLARPYDPEGELC